MKLAIALVLLATTTAYAGDSSWLLCKGIATIGAKADAAKHHIVASLHEHRGADGASRDLDVVLIYGAHINHGVIKNVSFGKADKLALSTDDAKPKSMFTGTLAIPQDLKTAAIKGSIDFDFGQSAKATMEPFDVKLTCETLDDLAIGH